EGTVIGCGVVSGRLEPYFSNNVDIERPTEHCQSAADQAEASAAGHGKPDIVLWGSQAERASILVNTPSGSEVLANTTPQWKAVMLRRINTRVKAFIADGAKVIFLLQPPFVDSRNPTRPTQSDMEFERMNGLLRQVAARHPGHVGLIDLSLRVCPSGPPCPYIVDGVGAGQYATFAVRPDGAHYGIVGSLWVSEWLVPRIVATTNRLS
ncbi:MAG: SGNH hydrolase domain-containing protein, partial [Acidimicrobiales bacterium]